MKIWKQISILLLFCMVICLTMNITTFAEGMEEPRQYVDANENVIEYYVDDEMHPYIMEEGEKKYILLPLEEFKVSDSKIIEELNQIRRGALMGTRSIPTNFVDLSTGEAELASNEYRMDISFENEVLVQTSVLKYNTAHSVLRIKTTNIEKESIFAGNTISFTIYYYYEAFDEWYADVYNGVDCTAALGQGFAFTPSTYTYGRFVIRKDSAIKSLTVNIWTTP